MSVSATVMIGCGDNNDDPDNLLNSTESLGGADCNFVAEGFGANGSTALQVETIASGLEVPWGLAFLPNGEIIVTERPGRIRIISGGVLRANPIVTINVGEGTEGGLLGIAAHPNFASNRFFYVYYTANKAGGTVNRVERFTLSADGASATSDRIIIDDIPAGTFHNGGRLRFGPDGNLYVGTGDGRNPGLAQSPNSLAGKILRLTPDGAIPQDNPTSDNAAFISGIRNTQGFDWINPLTLLVTDHGPTGELGRSGGDELSVANPGDNLGWPEVWQCGGRSGFESPILGWRTAAPPGGAAIYTGSAIPEWRGNLIIGTLGSKHLHRVVLAREDDAIRVANHEVYLLGDPPSGYGRLRDVVNGPDGFLYVTTSNCDGRGTCGAARDSVLRIRSRAP